MICIVCWIDDLGRVVFFYIDKAEQVDLLRLVFKIRRWRT